MNEELMQMLMQMLQQGGGQQNGQDLMKMLQGRQHDVNMSKGSQQGQNRPPARAQKGQQSGGMDKQKLMQLMQMLQQKKAQQ